MSNNYKKNKITKKSKKSTGFNFFLLPLMLTIGLMPLIVYMYSYNSGYSGFDFYPQNDGVSDFFLYYKALFFIVISAIMSCIVIIKLSMEKRKIKFKKIFIPIGVYALLSLLSAIFSEYASFSFKGAYEQFESVWVLLGYSLITYYAFLYITSEKDIKLILNVLLISTVIMLLIGLSQAFSHDFYRTDIGKHLIAPSSYLAQNDLDFNFELGRVYLSLYNPNYVGSYVALLSPVFLVLVFSAKKLYMIALYAIIYVSLLLTLYGSESRAGFAGIIASILLFIILYNRTLLKNWMPVTCIASLLVTSFLTMNNLSDGALMNKILSIFNPTEVTVSLEDIETNDDNVTFTYKGEKLVTRFFLNDNSYYIDAVDANGNPVAQTLSEDNMTFLIDDERFPGFKLIPANLGSCIGFCVVIDGHSWYFTNQTDGTYYMLNIYGKIMKAQHSESFEPLLKYGSTASGRGFIWAKTLPLLKDNIVLGTGPDNFTLAFPNDDFLAMYNYGYEGQIMTKPHNMYLQIAVQTGVISLIAFLAFYIWYFLWSVKLYIKKHDNTYLSFIGSGILAGTFGYMVVGIINDSTLGVAPIFWSMMGIGIAVNTLYSNKKDAPVINDIPSPTRKHI